jgi:hypothetical protein
MSSFAKLFKAGKTISPWATVTAAIVAIVTLYFGYQQFRQTQEATRSTLNLQREALDLNRESKAVELFVKYNEIMSAPRPVGKTDGRANDFWRVNIALSMAESIFILRKEDKGWRETVAWMLSNHAEDLKKKGLNCPTLDAEFVQLVNQVMKKNICNAP